MIKKQSNKKGFTLVELLVVISIIGILAGIFLNRIGDFRDRAEDARKIADIRSIQTILELYYNSCRNYPVSGDLCSENIPAGSKLHVFDQTGWDSLEAIIVDKVQKTSLPRDPGSPGKNYEYGSDDDGKGYVIKAELNRDDNPATKGNVTGTINDVDCGDYTPPKTTKNQYCIQF